jgi:hypothetical protein
MMIHIVLFYIFGRRLIKSKKENQRVTNKTKKKVLDISRERRKIEQSVRDSVHF